MIATTVNGSWTELTPQGSNSNVFPIDSTGNLTITLTAAQAQTLANGSNLIVMGQNFTLNKITYVAPNGTLPDSSSKPESSSSRLESSSSKTESSSSRPESSSSKTDTSSVSDSSSTAEVITKEVYDGSLTLEWNATQICSGYAIPEAVAGGTLTIEGYGSSGAEIMIATTYNGTWTELTPEGASSNVFPIGSDGTLTITLNAEQAELLANGKNLFVLGQEFTLTNLTYTGPGGTPPTHDSSSSRPDSSSSKPDSSSVTSSDNDDIADNAIDFAKNMKLGWNLGNTLDADGANDLTSETSWGQPKATKQLIDYVKSVGFTTIRIPVSWSNHVDSNNNIDSRWMSRVTEVVNYARSNDFYIIINAHHDCDAYYPTEANYTKASKYLKDVWTQISAQFANYDEKLVFETMNEPRLKDTSKEWWFSTNDSEGVASIKTICKLNQDCVDTIRNGTGYNKTRYIMCPSNAASPDNALNSAFSMPTDTVSSRLLVSVHAYRPNSFAMEGTGTSKWNSSMTSEFGFMDQLYNKFVKKGYGVVIGEFGATNKNNISDRVAWAKAYTEKTYSLGYSCVLWDNGLTGSGAENFGMINRNSLSIYYPELLNALLTYYK